MNILSNLWLSLVAGLFAPIGAVCVLPLYPGFLAYLASQLSEKDAKKGIVILGWIVTLGIVVSMFIFGLVFTTLLSTSLTNAIGIISPIAFGILALVSLLLIFNVDFGRIFPKVNVSSVGNPKVRAFVFGFFFGAIVLPCNPASLVVLFALSTSTMDFFTNLGNFLLFGIGMAFPLLVFSYISNIASHSVIGFLTRNKRTINLIAGLIMLAISLYYLLFVFKILS